jgi:hypothetical protein
MAEENRRRLTDSEVFIRKDIFIVVFTTLISSFMTAGASYIVLRERMAVVEREIVFLQKQIDRLDSMVNPNRKQNLGVSYVRKP